MKRYHVLSATIISLVVFYVYIISIHRIRDLDDVRAIVHAVSHSSVSNRCKVTQSAEYRCLPNVLFIGASKCGTTSLVFYMTHHNGIKFVNRRIHKDDKHREVHRFDRNTFGMALQSLELGDEWASSPIVSSPNVSVVHYTPHYLYAPTVPFEVKRFYPHESELKFVVMLREPVKRAWSSYWFHNSHLIQEEDQGSVAEFLQLAREEIEQRSIYNSCMDEKLLSQPLFAQFSTPSNSSASTPGYLKILIQYLNTKTSTHLESQHPVTSALQQDTSELEYALYQANQHCFGAHLRSPTLGTRHIDKGLYVDQIIRWFVSFRRDQFRFTLLEKFSAEPAAQFQDLLEFMNIPATAGSTMNSPNSSTTYRVYDPVIHTLDFKMKRLESPNARMPAWSTVNQSDLQFLYDFYKPYNSFLCELGVHCGY